MTFWKQRQTNVYVHSSVSDLESSGKESLCGKPQADFQMSSPAPSDTSAPQMAFTSLHPPASEILGISNAPPCLEENLWSEKVLFPEGLIQWAWLELRQNTLTPVHSAPIYCLSVCLFPVPGHRINCSFSFIPRTHTLCPGMMGLLSRSGLSHNWQFSGPGHTLSSVSWPCP